MNKKLVIILLFLFFIYDSNYAQDPKFSQFYSIPLYLNPALAGNTLQGRVIGNYRNQWPDIPGAFITYTFSYDQNISTLNSGIGLQVIRDQAGSGGLRFTNIGGQYAYFLALSEKLYLRSGMHFSLSVIDVDYTDIDLGKQGTTSTNYLEQKVGYWDFASGFILYSDKCWLGISSRHLTKPNKSLSNDESILPVQYDIHAGMNLNTNNNSEQKKSYFTPSFHYKVQEKNDQLDVGFYYTNSPIIIGIWYKGIPAFKEYQPGYIDNDAAVVLIGYSLKNLKIGYSYDIAFFRIVSNTGGSHELSLIYEFASDNSKNKQKREKQLVPCASF